MPRDLGLRHSLDVLGVFHDLPQIRFRVRARVRATASWNNRTQS